jgi:hypothetical protein
VPERSMRMVCVSHNDQPNRLVRLYRKWGGGFCVKNTSLSPSFIFVRLSTPFYLRLLTSFRPYHPCLPYLPLKDKVPFVSKGEITGADSNDHSLPPIGGALLSSASTTQHSLVVNKLATPLASVKAVLTTLTGSKIPFSIMSQYSPTLASYP